MITEQKYWYLDHILMYDHFYISVNDPWGYSHKINDGADHLREIIDPGATDALRRDMFNTSISFNQD